MYTVYTYYTLHLSFYKYFGLPRPKLVAKTNKI
jgi:hypothetical protein